MLKQKTLADLEALFQFLIGTVKISGPVTDH